MLNRFLRPEIRYARRMARIARWDQPVAGLAGRLGAWAHMLLADHGVLRLAYLNRHRVSGGLWRSAQPAPHQLARFAAEGGRTVINLRGGREHGSWQLQREACERLGLELVELVLRSREAPRPETIREAEALFRRIEYPALIHCKSGADRAGFAAALYLILHEGRPTAEALRQLSPRYGHLRFSKTGILDAFLERYRREGEARGLSLPDWAEGGDYDAEALNRSYRPGFWSDLAVDRIMRRE